MNSQETMRNKTIKGMVWSFLDTVGSKVIQLGMQIFLARLLIPHDYGIIGIVTIFLMLSQVLSDSGFANALIREKEVSQQDYSTVFIYNLAMGVSLYVILFLSSGMISQFFELPQLSDVLKVYGLVIIIEAAGMVQKVILTKNLEFSIQMKINLTASIVSGSIAIACAVLGYGVWSLVIKMLLFHLFQTTFYFYFNRWKPTIQFSKASFTRLFTFGWKLMVSNIIAVLYENLYVLIIGRSFSTASLGYYTNSRKISDAASVPIALSVEKVSYPVLSKYQDDDRRLKEGFRKVIRASVFIAFPVMLGLAATAPVLFRLLLGEQWIPATSYFQVLCFSAMFISLHMINLNILNVKGRSDLFLKVNLFEKSIGFTIVAAVLILNLGITGLLWGLVLSYIFTYFINASYSKKLISYSIFEQLNDIKGIALISGVMALAAYSLNSLAIQNDSVLLFTQISVSVILYSSLSHLFKIEELKIVYQLVAPIPRKIFLKKPA